MSGLVRSASSERLFCLDWIRGLAALAVVLYHAEAAAHQYLRDSVVGFVPPSGWFGFGWIGVPVFFVLSGYVIPASLQRRRRSAGEFLSGRFWRLYPTYLLISFFFMLLVGFLSSFLGEGAESLTLSKSLSSLAFGWGRIDQVYLYVAWTLFWEVIFYLLAAPFAARVDRSLAVPLLLMHVIVLVLALHPWGPFSQPLIYIVSFYTGVAVWAFSLPPVQGHGRRPADWFRFVVFVAGIALLLLNPIDSGFCRTTALTAATMVILLAIERRRPTLFQLRPMLGLGRISYSLFLIQVITLPLVMRPWSVLISRSPSLSSLPFPLLKSLGILLAALLSLGAAWLSWWLLEARLSHWLEGSWQRMRSSRRSAA